MGAVTNLALRHQPANQIFCWYLLRTHLGSVGFGMNPGWRGPRDSDQGARDTLVLPTVSTIRAAGLTVDTGQPAQPQPHFGEH